MELSPVNKTEIILFIIDQLVLKLWNVSTKMRKRVQWILKGMELTLKKYDSKALSLTKWVKLMEKDIYIESLSEIKKGVSNYIIANKNQLNRLTFLNNELKCHEIRFAFPESLPIDSSNLFYIFPEKIERCSQQFYKKLKKLELFRCSSDQIKQILSQIKSLVTLEITDSTLTELDLSFLKIKNLKLENLTLIEPLKLPFSLDYLAFESIKGIQNLTHPVKLNKLFLSGYFAQNEPNSTWLKGLKSLKILEKSYKTENILDYLPSNIREVNFFDAYEPVLESLTSGKDGTRFCYLTKIGIQTPISECEKLNLRSIRPIIEKNEAPFELRPREIIVESEEKSAVNEHPELFQKIEFIEVKSNTFKFDHLNPNIKRIILRYMNFESLALIRLD